MPSRKKSQGKARREAKAQRQQLEQQRQQPAETPAAVTAQQDCTLDLQMMQQLQIHNHDVQEERNGFRPTEEIKLSFPCQCSQCLQCSHGYNYHRESSSSEEPIHIQFVDAFMETYDNCYDGQDPFLAAYRATREKFPGMWNDYTQIEKLAIPFMLANAVDEVLRGDNENAHFLAHVIRFLEEWIAVELRKTQATINWVKVWEKLNSDDHTLVKFFRLHIPCKCLDEKYEQVKSVKKMGICDNYLSCSHPDGKIERSKMMDCSLCRRAIYCSRKCQKADWKNHKTNCKHFVKMEAEFNMNKRQCEVIENEAPPALRIPPAFESSMV